MRSQAVKGKRVRLGLPSCHKYLWSGFRSCFLSLFPLPLHVGKKAKKSGGKKKGKGGKAAAKAAKEAAKAEALAAEAAERRLQAAVASAHSIIYRVYKHAISNTISCCQVGSTEGEVTV